VLWLPLAADIESSLDESSSCRRDDADASCARVALRSASAAHAARSAAARADAESSPKPPVREKTTAWRSRGIAIINVADVVGFEVDESASH
jgi:hypothetical protein